MKYFSQLGQDEYLDQEVFMGLGQGVFVDFGAYDGRTFSNTFFFEKHRGWTGVCAEPIPSVFENLRQNRSCICVPDCIAPKTDKAEYWEVTGPSAMLSGLRSGFEANHIERIHRETRSLGGEGKKTELNCITLNALFERHRLTHVQYCSVDTEGSELSILKTFDFHRFRVDVFGVENNSGSNALRKFMNSKGYVLLRSDCDEIFRRKDPHAMNWRHHFPPRITRLCRRLLSTRLSV